MACPRCGRNRIIYRVELVKFYGVTSADRMYELCQPCISEIIGFIDARSPFGFICNFPKCLKPGELRMRHRDDPVERYLYFSCDEHKMEDSD